MNGVAASGVVAQDMAQVHNMWRIREGVTEALSQRGECHSVALYALVHCSGEMIEHPIRDEPSALRFAKKYVL